jgi:S1-C subfamily serine protease
VFAVFVGSAGVVSGAQIQDSVLSKFYAPDEIPASFPIDATAYRQALSSVAKFGDASGVVIEGGYFVTARHVAEYARRKNLHAIIAQDDNGQWHEVPIEETPFTSHSLPYDIAIYRIVGQFGGLPARLQTQTPAPSEPAYGIGFVWDPNVKETPDRKRVALGSVANANIAGESFCEYTNEDDVTVIENWKLEAPGCAGTDYSQFKYHAREERDPLLARSAMTFGMSGSPLFNKDGGLISVGSNVLSSTPLLYDRNKLAVYVKSANIAKLIEELEKH